MRAEDGPPKEPSAANGLSRAWSGLFQIAGAVAGLGALIYAVGAATLWLRFESANLPADVAIAHEPHSDVAALGVRGLVGLGSITLIVLLGFAYALSYVFLKARARVKGTPSSLPRELLIDVIGSGIKSWGAADARRVGVLSVLVIWAASLWDWRAFGSAVFVVVITAATLLYLHARGNNRAQGLPLALIVSFVIAAAFLGASWQVNSLEPVQAVVVYPQRPHLPSDFAIPYFGEDGSLVYVGKIVRRTNPKKNESPWTYCHRVVEIHRDKVKLSFVSETGKFGSSLKRPLLGIIDLFRGKGLAFTPPEDPACRN